jgi:hypothetical protein
MSRDRKILIFVIIVSVIVNLFVILNYEAALKDQQAFLIKDGVKIKTEYTTAEIIDLIKQDQNYMGDSVVIYEDGSVRSANAKFQGTLDHVSTNPPDVDIIEQQVRKTSLPKPVVTYGLAAHYYLSQYPEERELLRKKKQADSVQLKQADTTVLN